jgi:hypothetical protein
MIKILRLTSNILTIGRELRKANVECRDFVVFLLINLCILNPLYLKFNDTQSAFSELLGTNVSSKSSFVGFCGTTNYLVIPKAKRFSSICSVSQYITPFFILVSFFTGTGSP